jgi:hypothetical protein
LDYEERNPVGIPVPFLRLVSGLFTIIYLILGAAQILVSSGYLANPGIMSEDIVGGFILLVISSTFAVGAFLPPRRSGEIRSFFLVGSSLAVIHGMTGLLVNLSSLLSDLLDIGEDEFDIINLAEPSIILSLMIITSGILVFLILKGSQKGRLRT